MTHLKFSTDIDIIPFLNAVKGCEGEVELRTPMGDVLNLKSELSRYLLVSVLAKPELIASAEIVCREEDAEKLKPYLKENSNNY